jgi:hypothetical protein
LYWRKPQLKGKDMPPTTKEMEDGSEFAAKVANMIAPTVRTFMRRMKKAESPKPRVQQPTPPKPKAKSKGEQGSLF